MPSLREVAQAVQTQTKRKLARGSVVFLLPIYEGRYAARFGVLDAERVGEVERMEDHASPTEVLEAQALFIADACQVILGAAEPGGKRGALTHTDGRPVRFDEEFAEALELEPAPDHGPFASSADVVLACWTAEDDDGKRALNSIALNLFALRLLEWMSDTRAAVEGELVGGSNGSRQ